VKKFVAPVVIGSLFIAMALPAFGDSNVIDLLKQLSQAEQSDHQVRSVETGALDGSALLVPTQDDVETDLDLELGDTRADRLVTLVTKLNQSPQPDFDTLTKLGIAYQMQGNRLAAKGALEKAIKLEPAGQPVYDLLANASQNGISIYVNGEIVPFDVQPQLIKDRTMVPIRKVTEKLGSIPTWDGDTATVTILYGPMKIEVTKDAPVAMVNGMPVTLDSPATIIGDRKLLPLRFVTENMGQQVNPHWATDHPALVISIVEK
jgi:hypothetical protein